MTPLNALIFGLGLFFLGLRLVGENLKTLTGGSLRQAIARTTRVRPARAALGVAAGALFQSATAVTFICVSMVAAGMLTVSGAGGVIVWSNVGLTAMAFVATLDIHPVVAFVVGGGGIVLGVVRVHTWQTVAGVLLGIGLILLGLQQMSEGAAPLKDEAWFRQGIGWAVSSVPAAFAAGVLAAAILQSNTGATMMVITLAGAGVVDFRDAALLIYGTNLGAIALRMFLSAGMRGDGLRLVRLEDFFCVLSGILMMALYGLEAAGIPLVLAFAEAIASTIQTRLAVVFLLSNLLPALLLTPLLPACFRMLKRMLPAEPHAESGRPVFLSDRALADPPTALDLLRKELARLLSFVGQRIDQPAVQSTEPDASPEDFQKLAAAIERFSVRLAAGSNPSEQATRQIHILRTVLSSIRHLEEAARFYASRVSEPGVLPPDATEKLNAEVVGTLSEAVKALDQADEAAATALREKTKSSGPWLTSLRTEVFDPNSNVQSAALYEDCRMLVWTIHRLAKLLSRGA